MQLTDTHIKTIKPLTRPKKYFDGGGLFLYVTSSGSKLWRIAAHRMKMKQQHIVPLSRQAVNLLRKLKEITGTSTYLFPSPRTDMRPVSDVTMLNALRRMGYAKYEMSMHGFRSMASTLLNELGYNRDWIKRQLAHNERDDVRAAYNYAQYLPERRKMMQEWSDYLSDLRNQSK